jgi:hypothetical protein
MEIIHLLNHVKNRTFIVPIVLSICLSINSSCHKKEKSGNSQIDDIISKISTPIDIDMKDSIWLPAVWNERRVIEINIATVNRTDEEVEMWCRFIHKTEESRAQYIDNMIKNFKLNGVYDDIKRSYNFGTFWVFGNQLIFLLIINNKGFVISCQNTTVDINIPIFQGCANSLYFSLYTLLNRRKHHPTTHPETANNG